MDDIEYRMNAIHSKIVYVRSMTEASLNKKDTKEVYEESRKSNNRLLSYEDVVSLFGENIKG